MSKKISNALDEFQAKEKIESIFPDPHIRNIGIGILAEGIIKANSIRRDNWAITNSDSYPNSIWFQVGHYATICLEKNSIWLALDKEQIENPVDNKITFLSSNEFGWEPVKWHFKDKHKPGVPFSINGYYSPKSNASHSVIWPYMRNLLFEFISKAEEIGQPMQRPTKLLHNPCILIYLRNNLKIEIPDPQYN
jgi:hypothetical protein